MNFRIIKTKEPIFKEMKMKYQVIFDDFKNYLLISKLEKSMREEVINTKKGKNVEYPRFLIFSLILYKEIFDDDSMDLNINIINKKLQKIKCLEGFDDFNKLARHKHFYSSTIFSFNEYTMFKNQETTDNVDLNCTYINYDIVKKARRKGKLVHTNQGLQYPRNLAESLEAKIRSNWTCEINSLHTTFINAVNENPYVEAHHLLPMAAQRDFEYTVDFADNIVSLCPNCHRKIHHGQKEIVQKMIEFLYEKRQKSYKQYAIPLDLATLLRYYNI